jgi:hypothetical protein
MILRTSARAFGGAFLILSAVGAALTLSVPAASAQGRVLGGFRDISTDDAGVQAAAAFAAGDLGGSLQSVDSAQTQSVAGANYRLTIILEDGAIWQVVVYRNLQGEHSLTSSTQTQAPPGEGEEVDTGSNQAPEDDDDA